jgi:hypothetical protein
MIKSMYVYLYLALTLLAICGCKKNGIFERNPDEINSKNIAYIGDYYVATNGNDNNPGTFDQPFATLQKAIKVSVPGDTTYIRGGIYYLKKGYIINPELSYGVSGIAGQPVCYFNYPGETPIFDCSYNTEEISRNPSGLGLHKVEYIKIRGIIIRNIRQNSLDALPIGIGCSSTANLTFENCIIHDIGGRGFSYWSGAWNQWDGLGEPIFKSDSTSWINCDTYNLCDSLSKDPGDAADGWKCHAYQGNILYWEGCRAWAYSDDGFDPSGQSYKIFNHCWAMSTEKYKRHVIEGNGFKIVAPSSEYYYPSLLQDTILVKVRNCIATFCYGSGFLNNLYLNGSTYLQDNAQFLNNTAYRCNIGFSDHGHNQNPFIGRTSIYKNNISYKSTSTGSGKNPLYDVAIYGPSIYVATCNSWIPTMELNGWPGWKTNPDFLLTDADFKSLIPDCFFQPRKQDGSLPDTDFLKLNENSTLKKAGVYVGMSHKPDIGIDWDFVKSY